MKKSRFTTEQIIGFIKQAEAGMAVSELARQNGFSPASFYAWRAKYGGMEAEDAKRLKERLVNDAVKALSLTKVIIAHRPQTIASADRVLVMEQGRIVREIRPQQPATEPVAVPA